MNRLIARSIGASTLVLASLTAHADVATSVAAIQTGILADIGTVEGFVYAVLVATLSFWIGLKLVKRGANRAT